MKEEKKRNTLKEIINVSASAFFEYPVCILVWGVNIVAIIVIIMTTKENLFLKWMIVSFAEFFLLVLLSSYVNFIWCRKKKKTE